MKEALGLLQKRGGKLHWTLPTQFGCHFGGNVAILGIIAFLGRSVVRQWREAVEKLRKGVEPLKLK